VFASVTLLVAAFVAALLPSLRAAATDPVNALRQD
jgi:ABC-type lipoprotein release transport system permease subunit